MLNVRSIRRRLFLILEAGEAGDRVSRVVDWLLVLLIIANVAAATLSTVQGISERYGPELRAFELFSVAVFTVEYLLRIWVCNENPMWRHKGPFLGRLKFALRPLSIIDLAAILPFYIALLYPTIDLRALRAFRLLRLFKLVRYSPAMMTMTRVVTLEWRALSASLLIMIAVTLAASTAMYYVEGDDQPDAFSSIPAAMWWALATLTTVGYGDVVPVTVAGRVLGGFVMIFGLGMFALPIGIIASGFAQEIQRREFVITWGMVAKVPIFQRLNASTIAHITNVLRSRQVRGGGIIYAPGDPANEMYFVATGEVEVQFRNGKVCFGEGEFFGEVSLLRRLDHVSKAVAVTDCRLMVLEHSDFQDLLRGDTELREAIHAASHDRIEAWKANMGVDLSVDDQA